MTVSYTCQKPIKFWAKCKINLLYKLNQPFCVFQAALSSWQKAEDCGPTLLALDLVLLCLFTRPFFPQSMSCHIHCHHLVCSSDLSLRSVDLPRKSEESYSASPALLLCPLQNLLEPLWSSFLSSSILLFGLRQCPLPSLVLNIYRLLKTLVPQFLCQ